MRHLPARRAWDRHGGIEGLPLQLLIMVVVAGIGMTVIIGWMGSIKTPQAIGTIYTTPSQIIVTDPDGDGRYTNDAVTLTVVVTDQNGARLAGAAVLLSGASLHAPAGTSTSGITDARGEVEFTSLSVEVFGRSLGSLTVTVAKSGYGSEATTQVPILPE